MDSNDEKSEGKRQRRKRIFTLESHGGYRHKIGQAADRPFFKQEAPERVWPSEAETSDGLTLHP